MVETNPHGQAAPARGGLARFAALTDPLVGRLSMAGWAVVLAADLVAEAVANAAGWTGAETVLACVIPAVALAWARRQALYLDEGAEGRRAYGVRLAELDGQLRAFGLVQCGRCGHIMVIGHLLDHMGMHDTTNAYPEMRP